VHREKSDSEPESNQGDGLNDPKTPISIKWGHSSLRKWIIFGVLGSFTGLFLKR
jgi:hypothetical protein